MPGPSLIDEGLRVALWGELGSGPLVDDVEGTHGEREVVLVESSAALLLLPGIDACRVAGGICPLGSA